MIQKYVLLLLCFMSFLFFNYINTNIYPHHIQLESCALSISLSLVWCVAHIFYQKKYPFWQTYNKWNILWQWLYNMGTCRWKGCKLWRYIILIDGLLWNKGLFNLRLWFVFYCDCLFIFLQPFCPLLFLLIILAPKQRAFMFLCWFLFILVLISFFVVHVLFPWLAQSCFCCYFLHYIFMKCGNLYNTNPNKKILGQYGEH